MNDFYSDQELKILFGMRPHATSLFEPMELGWVCPIDCHHKITWSEFVDHIWCYPCQRDYFTLLCPKQMNPFTTDEILEEEKRIVIDEMKKWTMKKYKELKGKPIRE